MGVEPIRARRDRSANARLTHDAPRRSGQQPAVPRDALEPGPAGVVAPVELGCLVESLRHPEQAAPLVQQLGLLAAQAVTREHRAAVREDALGVGRPSLAGQDHRVGERDDAGPSSPVLALPGTFTARRRAAHATPGLLAGLTGVQSAAVLTLGALRPASA